MSNKEVYLTEEGLKEKQNELEYLKTDVRTEIAEKIRVARGFGDLSENAEYDQAKLEQAQIEEKIAKIEDLLRNVKIIDKNVSTKVVGLGAKVRVKDLEFGDTIEYALVGSAETDPINGRISNESPVGKQLLGKKKGDIVEINTPGGIVKYEILAIKK